MKKEESGKKALEKECEMLTNAYILKNEKIHQLKSTIRSILRTTFRMREELLWEKGLTQNSGNAEYRTSSKRRINGTKKPLSGAKKLFGLDD